MTLCCVAMLCCDVVVCLVSSCCCCCSNGPIYFYSSWPTLLTIPYLVFPSLLPSSVCAVSRRTRRHPSSSSPSFRWTLLADWPFLVETPATLTSASSPWHSCPKLLNSLCLLQTMRSYTSICKCSLDWAELCCAVLCCVCLPKSCCYNNDDTQVLSIPILSKPRVGLFVMINAVWISTFDYIAHVLIVLTFYSLFSFDCALFFISLLCCDVNN